MSNVADLYYMKKGNLLFHILLSQFEDASDFNIPFIIGTITVCLMHSIILQLMQIVRVALCLVIQGNVWCSVIVCSVNGEVPSDVETLWNSCLNVFYHRLQYNVVICWLFGCVLYCVQDNLTNTKKT